MGQHIVGGYPVGYNPYTAQYLDSLASSAPAPTALLASSLQQTPQSTPATQNLNRSSLLSSDTVEAANKASTRGEIPTDDDLVGADPETAQQIKNDAINRLHGGGMSDAELQDFETLVGRLEESKMKQAGQTNRARQRETYGKGLASIMRNF